MRNALLVLSLLLPFAWLHASKIYTTENLPNVHIANKYAYVTDPEGILRAQTRETVNQILYQLETKTGIQTVVAVVPSIGEVSCFDFSHELLNKWGVGQKGKDNGLVILLVTDQRCIQFYTGYGLEGPLPDAICKRIQSKYMVPFLRNNDWDGGILNGTKAVYGQLINSMQNDGRNNGSNNQTSQLYLIIFLFIAGAIAIVYSKIWLSSKCPQCGKHKLQRTDTKLISIRNGIKTEDITYTCLNCGHTIVRRQENYDDNFHNPRRPGGGPFIGGGFGGFGGSGGGFGGGFGGSFGGGSGGGGGAGSRF